MITTNRKNDVPGVLPALHLGSTLAGARIVNSAVRRPLHKPSGARLSTHRYRLVGNTYQILHWFGSLALVPKHTHSSDCFFPASGNRNNSNGNLNNVGSNGYYWTGNTSNTNGIYINMWNDGEVKLENTNNRANGNSLRCLQAFTPFFLSTLQKAERFSGTAQEQV